MTMRLMGTPKVESPYGAGSTIWFYAPSTLTPKDVYSDTDLTTPINQASGIAADSAGIWPEINLQASLYRIIIKNAAGVTKQDVDNVDPGLAAGFGVSSVVGVEQGGTGANNAAAARANLGAASSEGQTLIQNTVTDLDAKVDTGLNVSDPTRFGLLAKEDAVTRALMAAGTGDFRIQRVKHITVVDNTITTTTPAFDTSKPQVSEGDQIFTKAFTPLSASSTIRIRVFLTGDQSSNNGVVTYGLFKDADADAIAADGINCTALSTPFQGILEYEVASGSTASRTYSVRAGVSAGQFNVNGSTGTLGGLRVSYILIEEWVTV